MRAMSTPARVRLAAVLVAALAAGCATRGGDPALPDGAAAEPAAASALRPDPALYVPPGPLVLPAIDTQTPNRAAALRLVERAARDLAEGRDDTASRELDRALRVDPTNPYATFLVALHRHRQGAFDQSLAFGRKAEILLSGDRPWLAEAYRLNALSQEALGRPREALRLYEAALGINPDDTLARGRAADLRRANP
jgi:tetratricopeptide (TPR) repeat protein